MVGLGLLIPIQFTAGSPLTSADFLVEAKPTDLVDNPKLADFMPSTELAESMPSTGLVALSHLVESVGC